MPTQVQGQMPTGEAVTAGELFERAQAAFRSGRTEEALGYLEAFLKQRPGHGIAWNLAGACNRIMGRYEKAVHCFKQALPLSNTPSEVLVNLFRTYLTAGKTAQAASLLKLLPPNHAQSAELVLDLSSRLVREDQPHWAMDILLEQKDRLTNSQIPDSCISDLHSLRPKLAVFCGADGMTFFNEIFKYLEPRYQVRVFEGKTTEQMRELMEWSDVSWFEWCSNLAVLASQMSKVCRMIVRLHRYEAYMSWPRQINWDHVDLLITVGNSTVMRALEVEVPDIHQRVAIVKIPNGVNLKNIPFARRSAGKSIAFVASMRMVKNPMLLLQCMANLYAIDPEYHLYIAGRMSELLVEQYFLHQVHALGLDEVVHFDGWQADIPGWLADKQYLAVTSVIESQGMGILEAMASGIKPVIHNFPGAAEIYGTEYLFNTPEEFSSQILSREYDSASYRTFVEQRYPLDRFLMKIDEIVASFERVPVAANAS